MNFSRMGVHGVGVFEKLSVKPTNNLNSFDHRSVVFAKKEDSDREVSESN